MNKPLIAVGATIVAAALITPKFIGNSIDNGLDELVAQLNNTPGYNVELTGLEQSWFGTNAVLKVNFDDSQINVADVEQSFSMNFELKISADHGPVLLGESSTMGLASWQASLIENDFIKSLDLKAQPFYQLSGVTSLMGSHYFSDSMPTFTTDLPADEGKETVVMQFGGYAGEGSIKGKVFEYTTKMGKTVVTAESGVTTLDKATVIFSGEGTIEQVFTNGMYDSIMEIKMGSLIASNGDTDPEVEIEELKFYAVSDLDEANNIADMSFGFAADKFKNAEFVANDMVLEFQLNQFNADVVKQFQEMQNNLVDDNGMPNQEAAEASMLKALTSYLESNPSFNLSKAQFTLKEGQFNGVINTKFVDALPLPEMSQLSNPAFWLGNLLADGNIKADKEVMVYLAQKMLERQIKQNPQAKDMTSEEITGIAVAQAGMVVQNLLAQGFIVENEQGYETNMLLKDKQLTVNEQVIPLPI